MESINSKVNGTSYIYFGYASKDQLIFLVAEVVLKILI